MAMLFKSDSDRFEWWKKEIGERMPDLELRRWPEVGDPQEIEYALVWKMAPGILKTFSNLKMIVSLGAGVDHLFLDPELPKHVPICRVIDPNLTQRMSEYVVFHALRYHRRQPEYDALQRAKDWRELYTPTAQERGVGVMGLGELGADAARHLRMMGFKVAGWSRTRKAIDRVEIFHGESGLEPFLKRTEILICLLPLTPQTEGILSKRAFDALPKGACLINAARGPHVVDADLLAALESGQIAHATLDVFHKEPLPADHPYWTHPRVTVTPHVASITDPRTVADLVKENVRRHRAGEPLLYVVDPEVGY